VSPGSLSLLWFSLLLRYETGCFLVLAWISLVDKFVDKVKYEVEQYRENY